MHEKKNMSYNLPKSRQYFSITINILSTPMRSPAWIWVDISFMIGKVFKVEISQMYPFNKRRGCSFHATRWQGLRMISMQQIFVWNPKVLLFSCLMTNSNTECIKLVSSYLLARNLHYMTLVHRSIRNPKLLKPPSTKSRTHFCKDWALTPTIKSIRGI